MKRIILGLIALIFVINLSNIGLINAEIIWANDTTEMSFTIDGEPSDPVSGGINWTNIIVALAVIAILVIACYLYSKNKKIVRRKKR